MFLYFNHMAGPCFCKRDKPEFGWCQPFSTIYVYFTRPLEHRRIILRCFLRHFKMTWHLKNLLLVLLQILFWAHKSWRAQNQYIAVKIDLNHSPRISDGGDIFWKYTAWGMSNIPLLGVCGKNLERVLPGGIIKNV